MYQPVSGWSTYVTDGRATSIDVVLSTRLTLNSTSHMASQIATMAINDAITKALSGLGMTASVNGTCQMFPHERFTVSISSMPVSLSTLPATVSHGSYFRCLYSIRSAVTKLVENGVDGKMLDVYKNALIDRYASTESDPAVLLRQISDRISQETGSTRYFPSAAIFPISLISGKKFIAISFHRFKTAACRRFDSMTAACRRFGSHYVCLKADCGVPPAHCNRRRHSQSGLRPSCSCRLAWQMSVRLVVQARHPHSRLPGLSNKKTSLTDNLICQGRIIQKYKIRGATLNSQE